jgi:hypothetical protein
MHHAMSFGRNPHVAKAEAAEQKADVADDERMRERAWREAAHLWDRAADRETDARRRGEYAARAELARTKADGQVGGAATEGEPASPPVDPRTLN